MGRAASKLVVKTPAGDVKLASRLVGAHNLEKLLLALGIASALDLDLSRAAEALSRESGAPGRLERCDVEGDDIIVLVDYAHTPDALARALDAVRGVAEGRVWCVFGCGGDRDPTKRFAMGEAVARRADVAVVTNDNPRTEDPAVIADAVAGGCAGGRARGRPGARPQEGDRPRRAFFFPRGCRPRRGQGARGLSSGGHREASVRRPNRSPACTRGPASCAERGVTVATPIGTNTATLDARAAAEATGGRIARARNGRVARGVTTDSRAATAGCAFIALTGERHDGHSFVGAAIGAGAVLVVVERGRAPTDERADAVEVDDTLMAWGAIAREHLRSWRRARGDARVVAVTGSAGKTTTKELCAALLRTVGSCHASAGNLKNRVGVPAVALQVEAAHRFAVLEIGMSLPGEIAALAAVAEPDVAVVINVGLAHAGGVGGTIDAVAREKGGIFGGVRPDGVVVASADDSAVMAQVARAPSSARATTFGRAASADYRLLEREPLGVDGSRVIVRRPQREASAFTLRLPGEGAALDFVAALAAAEAAAHTAIANERIEEALLGLAPIAGRMQVRRLNNRILVIDDAYNANPASMNGALAVLREMRTDRKVAVLGEMKELGPASEREHAALGDAVADAGVELFVSCGGLADVAARAAERRGVSVVFTANSRDAAQAAVERAAPGDAVLVKASRSIEAERVVEALVHRYGEEGR